MAKIRLGSLDQGLLARAADPPRDGTRYRSAAVATLAVCSIFVALICQLVGNAAAQGDAVRGFVERVNEAALTVSTAGSEQEARLRTRRMLAWAFDVPAIARDALGDAWDGASPGDRREFLKAFEDLIISEYVRRAEANRGMSLSFVGARSRADGYQLAATRVVVPDKAEQTTILLLRPTGRSWRAVDVITNGRSLLQSERQEYSRILETRPGDIGAVIDFIRNRELR